MADPEKTTKDCWDKADILLKFLAVFVAAFLTWYWNSQRTQRDAAAQMSKIAIGILTAPPGEKTSPPPLRDWARAMAENG